MAKKFIGPKELAFIARINKELIQKVIGQEIIYYPILADKTKAHDLYNEAVNKMWGNPIRTNALVYYENSTEEVTNLPPDSKYKIDVYFHKLELQERALEPKMGDFVKFGNITYEILTVTQPQIIFGQIEQKVMTKCSCAPARKGQFPR